MAKKRKGKGTDELPFKYRKMGPKQIKQKQMLHKLAREARELQGIKDPETRARAAEVRAELLMLRAEEEMTGDMWETTDYEDDVEEEEEDSQPSPRKDVDSSSANPPQATGSVPNYPTRSDVGSSSANPPQATGSVPNYPIWPDVGSSSANPPQAAGSVPNYSSWMDVGSSSANPPQAAGSVPNYSSWMDATGSVPNYPTRSDVGSSSANPPQATGSMPNYPTRSDVDSSSNPPQATGPVPNYSSWMDVGSSSANPPQASSSHVPNYTWKGGQTTGPSRWASGPQQRQKTTARKTQRATKTPMRAPLKKPPRHSVYPRSVSPEPEPPAFGAKKVEAWFAASGSGSASYGESISIAGILHLKQGPKVVAPRPIPAYWNGTPTDSKEPLNQGPKVVAPGPPQVYAHPRAYANSLSRAESIINKAVKLGPLGRVWRSSEIRGIPVPIRPASHSQGRPNGGPIPSSSAGSANRTPHAGVAPAGPTLSTANARPFTQEPAFNRTPVTSAAPAPTVTSAAPAPTVASMTPAQTVTSMAAAPTVSSTVYANGTSTASIFHVNQGPMVGTSAESVISQAVRSGPAGRVWRSSELRGIPVPSRPESYSQNGGPIPSSSATQSGPRTEAAPAPAGPALSTPSIRPSTSTPAPAVNGTPVPTVTSMAPALTANSTAAPLTVTSTAAAPTMTSATLAQTVTFTTAAPIVTPTTPTRTVTSAPIINFTPRPPLMNFTPRPPIANLTPRPPVVHPSITRPPAVNPIEQVDLTSPAIPARAATSVEPIDLSSPAPANAIESIDLTASPAVSTGRPQHQQPAQRAPPANPFTLPHPMEIDDRDVPAGPFVYTPDQVFLTPSHPLLNHASGGQGGEDDAVADPASTADDELFFIDRRAGRVH
ncbi:hypothetical protein HK104_003291 [Borealophlyctis nickersoniae]|nr:hypothetical protein HK104_003291 [Borealophlyctis nickersoniae]